MGSSSKKKDRESRKRRHEDSYDGPREKRHKHKKHHHKDKKHKSSKHSHETDEYSSRKHYEPEEKTSRHNYESDGSDVVEIIENDSPPAPSPPTLPPPTPESSSKSTEAAGSGQSAESLSIEETNKLRAKLGLKPLEVTSSKSSSSSTSNRKDTELKKDDLGEFYHKPAENLQLKAQQEKLRAKLSEIREKRQLNNKYSKMKTLGEDEDDDDIMSWVNKNREIEQAKKEAEKRAKMLEELDAQFGISDIFESEKRDEMKSKYTAKDLRGLTVQHDVDNFAEESSVILTLKDQGVLEEGEDVLVNVNMQDDERYKKNIENKKKKTLYNAYEDEEFDEYGNYQEKSLLSKYNEEIDGEKVNKFKIGYDNAVERKQAAIESVKAKLAQKTLVSIADTNLNIASDYYNEEELAKFKKPKKRRPKNFRAKGKLTSADELKPDNAGIEAIGSRRPKIKNETDYDIDDIPAVNISPTDIKLEDGDDDQYNKALDKIRKIKQKEDFIAKHMKLEVKTEQEEENIYGGNIILNETEEFCRTLGDIPTYGKAGNREEAEEDMEINEDAKPEENSDDDCEIIEPSNGWNSVDPTNQGIDSSQIKPQDVQILDEEPDVSTGVGAALKLAMSKGYLDKEQNNRPSNSRFAHLQAKHYSIEDKSYGEDGDRQNRRERYAGPITEFREKESFKPNVKLEYIDDDGHKLSLKEAFRYMSHKFHGKGPGKNKVEKRIKKGVQEQLMKKMSSTDTPLGTLNMLQEKQKETQLHYVVLSGNKQSTALSKVKT